MSVDHRLVYNLSAVLIERGRTLEVPTVLPRFWLGIPYWRGSPSQSMLTQSEPLGQVSVRIYG